MNKKPLLERIGERPTVAIKFCCWMVQVLLCLIIFSPWYDPEIASPALSEAFTSLTTIKVYGLLLGIPGAVGLFYMWKSDLKYARRIKKGLTYWSFLIFTYFTIIRLVAFGPFNIVWLSYLLIALTMGIVHLRLKWEDA